MLVLQLQSNGLFILIHLQFPGVILLLPLIGQKMSFKEFCLLYLGKCYRNDFLGIIGVIADSLNHLVFTMPFFQVKQKQSY
jgi:hypothetical protein